MVDAVAKVEPQVGLLDVVGVVLVFSMVLLYAVPRCNVQISLLLPLIS